MVVVGCGWVWLSMVEYGWLWLAQVGTRWLWLVLDGCGWYLGGYGWYWGVEQGRPTGCFTHGKPPFTATQSPLPQAWELEREKMHTKGLHWGKNNDIKVDKFWIYLLKCWQEKNHLWLRLFCALTYFMRTMTQITYFPCGTFCVWLIVFSTCLDFLWLEV